MPRLGSLKGVNEHAELDSIWAEHRPDTARRLAVLRNVAARAASGTLGEDQRRAGIAEAHALAGAASLFGFAEGTRLAREIERLLRDPGAELSRLVALTDELTRSLDRDRSAREAQE